MKPRMGGRSGANAGVCPAPRLARSVSASAAPLSLYIRAVTCIDGGRGFNIEAEYVKWESPVRFCLFLTRDLKIERVTRVANQRSLTEDSLILHRARPVESMASVAAMAAPTRSLPAPRGSPATRRAPRVRCRAVEEPKTRPDGSPLYRGALFPGVEVPEAGADVWRGISRVFPWGNGAPITEGVLGDLLKEEVRAAPLFIPLYDYYRKYGGVYNLGAGPKWFVVVSDPVAVRTMFKDKADSFSKGILTDIMEPIMGDGLIPAPKEIWAKRRPTVGAGFHGAWLKHMVLLFGASATNLADKLEREWADKDDAVNLEDELYAMALDVIGKAVFNYEFGALKQETPLIKAVYRVLR